MAEKLELTKNERELVKRERAIQAVLDQLDGALRDAGLDATVLTTNTDWWDDNREVVVDLRLTVRSK